MSNLWTSEEIAKATGGKVTTAWVANGVSIDTRHVGVTDRQPHWV